MVVVAQLVRALDCGSGGRGFESHHPPFRKPFHLEGLFVFVTLNLIQGLYYLMKPLGSKQLNNFKLYSTVNLISNLLR